jgi:hypothetical protein
MHEHLPQKAFEIALGHGKKLTLTGYRSMKSFAVLTFAVGDIASINLTEIRPAHLRQIADAMVSAADFIEAEG